MASGKSTYLERKWLDLILSNTAYSIPAAVYIGLWTVTPNAGGTGTEVTGGSYARLSVTNNNTNWPAATGSNPASKSNGVDFTFATPTAGWGTITGVSIHDAVSGGNMLYYGDLTTPKTVNSGDTVRFTTGSLVILEV